MIRPAVKPAPRPPIVAGLFYPAEPGELARQASELTTPDYVNAEDLDYQKINPTMLMLPHAGYMYSGRVAGLTISKANLPQTLIILGPCHRIRGQGFSVWPSGSWSTPLGPVPVNEELAAEIINSDGDFSAETAPHLQDHCIEVLLPLLKIVRPDLNIVPIAVSEQSTTKLRLAALNLAEIIHRYTANSNLPPPLLVVSSDMSHYISHEQAQAQDALALQAILNIDGPALFNTVAEHNISMCGVLPASLALQTCKALGATKAQLISYATSGEVSGDMSKVVGYAGVIIS